MICSTLKPDRGLLRLLQCRFAEITYYELSLNITLRSERTYNVVTVMAMLRVLKKFRRCCHDLRAALKFIQFEEVHHPYGGVPAHQIIERLFLTVHPS